MNEKKPRTGDIRRLQNTPDGTFVHADHSTDTWIVCSVKTEKGRGKRLIQKGEDPEDVNNGSWPGFPWPGVFVTITSSFEIPF